MWFDEASRRQVSVMGSIALRQTLDELIQLGGLLGCEMLREEHLPWRCLAGVVDTAVELAQSCQLADFGMVCDYRCGRLRCYARSPWQSDRRMPLHQRYSEGLVVDYPCLRWPVNVGVGMPIGVGMWWC